MTKTRIIDNLVDLAITQIGVKEYPANSNKQIYGVEYGWNGVAWCVIFVWWLFHTLGLDSLFYGGNKTASCGAYYRWAVANKCIVDSPQVGDIVIYSFRKNKDGSRETSHMGFVVGYDVGGVYSVEGNTSSNSKGSQDNGGIVYEHYRPYSKVYAFIRPNYDSVSDKNIENDNIKIIKHVVLKGETLTKLAKHYNTTVNAIAEYNNIKNPNLIKIGQVLSIREGYK